MEEGGGGGGGGREKQYHRDDFLGRLPCSYFLMSFSFFFSSFHHFSVLFLGISVLCSGTCWNISQRHCCHSHCNKMLRSGSCAAWVQNPFSASIHPVTDACCWCDENVNVDFFSWTWNESWCLKLVVAYETYVHSLLCLCPTDYSCCWRWVINGVEQKRSPRFSPDLVLCFRF